MAAARKDDWYAFVVLAASFLTQMINLGLVLCFGIYFVTLLDYFDGCTKKDVAIVGSIAYGTQFLTAPVSSVLSRRFGCRLIVMTGGLIAAGGCFLSCFAGQIHHLYVTFGLILGFGTGLAYLPTVGILPDYFERYRYFAVAFATVGAAAGSFIFQPILYRLILAYGWRGSMIINAGIALQVVVCGAVMKSRTVEPNLRLSSLFELGLFKEFSFYLMVLNCALWGGICYTVFSMVNSLVMAHGLDKEQSTMVASAMGLSNSVGRLCSSLVGHFSIVDRPLFYTGGTFVFVGATALATQCWTFWTLMAVMSLFGLAFGAMVAQLGGTLIDLFGIERLVSALGYVLFAVGFGGMLLPPLAAGLADVFVVETAFHLAGALGIVGTLDALLFTYLRRRQTQPPPTQEVMLEEIEREEN